MCAIEWQCLFMLVPLHGLSGFGAVAARGGPPGQGLCCHACPSCPYVAMQAIAVPVCEAWTGQAGTARPGQARPGPAEVRAPSKLSLFGDFQGPESTSKRGLAQDGLKLAPRAPWSRPGRVHGRKWVPPGSPKEAPGEPKRLQNRVKIEVSFPMPRGRFQDLSPGAPRDSFLELLG